MKLIAATGNLHKLEEFRRILTPLGIEVQSLKDAGVELDVEETGTTFAENAHIKARALHQLTGCGVVADDSGLCVDALNGEPGVHSARYMGEGTPHSEKIKGLLQELKQVDDAHRTARFECAICCVLPNGDMLESHGVCEGTIGHQPMGTGGFGFDPIFMVGDRSFAELDPQVKDAESHRGRALRSLAQQLRQSLQESTDKEPYKL